MALNSGTINASKSPIGTAKPNPDSRVMPSRQGEAPDFRPPVGLRPSTDPLFSIKFAGYRHELDEQHPWGLEERGNSKQLYGGHWDAPLTVFSLATFETQLYVQMTPNGEIPRATPQQGNEAYITTKSVLQKATATQTEVEQFVEVNETIIRINLKA